MTPLQNFVLMRPRKDKPELTIELPDSADLPATNQGEILALGAEVKLPIAVDDVVMFKPHLFDTVQVGKELLLIGREDGIIGKW